MHSQNLVAIRDQNRIFDSVVGLSHENLTLIGHDAPERISAIYQTEGWSQTLGVSPILGRGFTKQQETQGLASGVALLSYGLCQRHFGGASTILNSPMRLDGRTYSVAWTRVRSLRAVTPRYHGAPDAGNAGRDLE